LATALGQQSYISLANRLLGDAALAQQVALWPSGSDGATLAFPALCGFRITANNRESLLRDITALLADQGLPIMKAAGELADEDTAVVTVEVLMSDWLSCLELLSHLSYLQSVISVTRYPAGQGAQATS